MLEWTGERFIPGAGSAELAYEHFARYLFAARLAAGKDILDIGCGEGYGAFLLARTARRVLGVDRAEIAIEHARLRYRRANLEYQTADGARLPEGETFDLITCFEVIEHIPEDEQHALLGQVTRLLSENGIFLISTPNKPVYRDAGGGPDYNNPFHIREMTFTEFRDLLDPYFPAIRWTGQQTLVGNYLNSLPIAGAPAGAEPTPYLGRLVGEELIQGMPATLEETKYFVAVCAKERATLERLAPPGDFMLVDTASVGDREWHATGKWATTLEQRVKLLEEQLQTRLTEVETLQALIEALRTEGETEANQHQRQLEAQARSYLAQIEAQAREIERLKAEYDAQVLAYRAQFEEQAGVYRAQIERQAGENEAQAREIERLKAEYDAQALSLSRTIRRAGGSIPGADRKASRRERGASARD